MIADALATVQEWHADERWGRVVVESGDAVWVHFSAIEGRVLGALEVGEQVRVWCEPGLQQGEHQAERVVPMTGYDPNATRPTPPSEAYRSSLTIVDDPE
ncbi:cold-shock protein [Agrococcus jejuensis]|uniref:Cold shock protein, CspA family n=1 Tax=Agrococcus jejuensis TaxID=399736 RepID=A0A1G8FT39_9MICO|nr:cold shock domain-containing protein [Agrococcus jejuensis]SDH85328.1 Cold shock protein, CspA family [Agrococcus jejuensis]